MWWRRCLSAGAFVAVAACLPNAGGQWVKTIDDLIDRPGMRAPSQTMGGRWTRYSRFAPLAATRGDVSLFSGEQLRFRNRYRGFQYGGALSTAQLGVVSTGVMSSGWTGGGLPFNPEAAALSGLHAAVSPSIPLPGMRADYMPAVSAHLYTPQPAPSRFQEVCGLAPPPTPRAGETVPTMVEQLQTQAQERAQRAEYQGRELFRLGTVETRVLDPETKVERYPECDDCGEKLMQAIAHFTVARDLDPNTYVPLLLMIHALLEQNRPRQALGALLEAIRRNPAVFQPPPADAPRFDEYFGDVRNGRSAVLEYQMRRYTRIGELNPNSAEALVLEAYCAWRLGETARANQAARQAEAMALKDPKEAGYLWSAATALRAATQ